MLDEVIKGVKQRVRPGSGAEKCWLTVKKCLCYRSGNPWWNGFCATSPDFNFASSVY